MTVRQRTAPPMDRTDARRGESGGGVRNPAVPETLAVGLETELARYPGTVYDKRIMRDRGPFYEKPRYVPPPATWISWTAAGPTRPELHMRNVTWRNMVGNSRSRFPVVDSPTTGMHTMGPAGTARTAARYVRTPQMRAPRQYRLAAGQYAGQTYSQTTQTQGGRRTR